MRSSSGITRSVLGYPREGRRLLPRILLPYFGDDPVDCMVAQPTLPTGLRFRDLDDHVWQDFTRATVDALAELVASAIQRGYGRLLGAPEMVFEAPVPFGMLRLPLRTRNSLLRHRAVRDGVVYPIALGELAGMRGVGPRSLLDLLTSVEEVGEAADSSPASDTRLARLSASPAVDDGRRPSRAVQREARKLMSRRWASKVTRQDPRLGPAVAALMGGALTALAAADLATHQIYSPAAAKLKAGAIRRFVSTVDALAKKSLEVELDEILRAVTTNEMHCRALRRRFGWGGSLPGTLEQCAQEVGVTRERVRQIEVKFRRYLETPVFTPALDRALRLLQRMHLEKTENVREALSKAGVVSGDFPIGSIFHTASLFGRDVPRLIERDGLLTSTDFAESLNDLQTQARRLTDRWGTTTVAELTAVLGEQGVSLDEAAVRLGLDIMPNVRYLDSERNWFWIAGSNRNRLLNVVRKIVSVAGSIEVGELRDGVGRHHRMRGFRPPRKVLARLCEDTGQYRIVGDRIVGVESMPSYEDVLSPSERLLADALFEYGPVMRREDLEDLVVGKRRMNRSSFYMYLGYSPILVRYAPGVYGLRGSQVTAAQVSALIPPFARSRVLRNHGWTDDRRIWIVYRLSAAAIASGVLSVPGALTAVLRGQFQLVTNDGAPMGTLVVDDSRLWGVSPFYRRRGVEPGDDLLLTFDTEARSASIEAGDQGIAVRHESGEFSGLRSPSKDFDRSPPILPGGGD